jgi:hypothetical protein
MPCSSLSEEEVALDSLASDRALPYETQAKMPRALRRGYPLAFRYREARDTTVVALVLLASLPGAFAHTALPPPASPSPPSPPSPPPFSLSPPSPPPSPPLSIDPPATHSRQLQVAPGAGQTCANWGVPQPWLEPGGQ